MKLALQSMDIRLILVIGCTLLAAGASSLLLVKMSSPRLRGLHWLGFAFTSAVLGTIILLFSDKLSPLLSNVLADALILLAFILLHVSFLDLFEAKSLTSDFGPGLLTFQIIGYLLLFNLGYGKRSRLFLFSLLIAAQVLQTAVLLIRKTVREIQAPGRFSAYLLIVFAAFNLANALMMTFSFAATPAAMAVIVAVGDIIFIDVGLGLAFGFFWLTTARLSWKLDELGSIDSLTGLLNRRVFVERCNGAMERYKCGGIPFCLLLMDIDHFKGINDRFGHHSGDAVLLRIVEEIRWVTRDVDVLGRWGGEEFVILLPNASPEDAVAVGERVRYQVEGIKLSLMEETQPHVNVDHVVTVSLGGASYRGLHDTIQEMLHRADNALYEVKKSGRNRLLLIE